MRECTYLLEALLTHRPPMLLLDQVIGYDERHLAARVTITEASLFLAPQGVPAYLAIEYMAQACGAFAGVTALDAGEPVKIGFLIGARGCRLLAPWFRVGDQLLVSSALVFRDEQMAVFDCKIEIAGELAAAARLNVYQPDNALLGVDESG
ncbi:MAG: 3-hydroxylacyl-ACP dehydratase [Candidatus Binataceae bacterium]